jgi:hypothetical protein
MLRGVGMSPSDIHQEAFGAWLQVHREMTFEHPAACFDSPLARWLGEMTGYVYGVDGERYGRACWEYEHWLPLPWWARSVMARLDGCSFRVFTCSQVMALVAEVDMMSLSRYGKWQAIGA